MKFSFLFLFIFFFSFTFIFAQDKESFGKNSANEQSQSQKKLSLQEKIKKLDKNRLYSTEYDKFEDETLVNVSLSMKDESFKLSDIMEKTPTELYGIDLTVSFRFKGQELQRNIENFVLRFSATSREWRWINNKDFIAIIDGERVKLGDGNRNSEVRKGGSVYESLYWILPKEMFEKLANGKNVEVRVGKDELNFNSKQLQRLKAFLSLSEIDK